MLLCIIILNNLHVASTDIRLNPSSIELVGRKLLKLFDSLGTVVEGHVVEGVSKPLQKGYDASSL